MFRKVYNKLLLPLHLPLSVSVLLAGFSTAISGQSMSPPQPLEKYFDRLDALPVALTRSKQASMGDNKDYRNHLLALIKLPQLRSSHGSVDKAIDTNSHGPGSIP